MKELAMDKGRIEVGNTAKSLAGDAMQAASREPVWSEIGLEQKVERLREALLLMSRQLNTAGQTAAAAHELVHSHEHVAGRGLMKPATGGHGLMGAEASSTSWSEYPLRRVQQILG